MEELESVLGGLMVDGRIVPVTCGSAIKSMGVDRLVTLLDEIAESRPITMVEHGEEVVLARDPAGDPVLRAFKVIVDPYVGRIVVMEVVSGTVANEAVLTNSRTKSEERLHGLNYLFGSKLVPVDKAETGDVVAVAKLTGVQVGDVLEKRGRNLAPAPKPPPTPAMSVAVIGTGKDDEKVSTSLHRLAEEDPSLRVRFDATSRHLVIDVMGEMHLQATLERLRRRFNVEVTTAPPPVPYFETILKASDVEGRLKNRRVATASSPSSTSRSSPSTRRWPSSSSTRSSAARCRASTSARFATASRRPWPTAGPPASRSSGVRATLYDGKSHSVDSSEAAFETAGSIALKAALEKSGTALLERSSVVECTVPASTSATC